VTALRIAFCGASGTGKSTLAAALAAHFNLPLNPVGSRSVSAAMGYASPYDVDRAGRRAEFQRRLLANKCAWEAAHESFVTDRTTLDNLAYQALHAVESVTGAVVAEAVTGLARYTHVFYCPVWAFCAPGDDSARVQDLTYHRVYDAVLRGFLESHPVAYQVRMTLWTADREERLRVAVGTVAEAP
jgi:predicted ATPase